MSDLPCLLPITSLQALYNQHGHRYGSKNGAQKIPATEFNIQSIINSGDHNPN